MPRRGDKLSLETRAKMSAVRTGKRHSPASRAKMSEQRRGVAHFNQRGEKHGNWKGGRREYGYGYVGILVGVRKYIAEHRLVMSEVIGRELLPEERVHHVNEVKTDNRPENLWLWPNQGSHAAWHRMIEHGHELQVSMPAVHLRTSPRRRSQS